MADDFQICSGGSSWWDPARTTANSDSMPSSLSRSTAMCDIGGTGNFSWTAAELMESKAARSCDESAGSAASGSSVTFQDSSNLKSQTSDASPQLIDSTIQLSSFGISSHYLDWTNALLRTSGGTSFHALLQEDLSSKNYAQHDQRLHMGIDNSSSCSSIMLNMNQSFELGQQHHLSAGNESGNLGISSFPLTPSSYGCSPSILQGLLEVPGPGNKVLQQSIYDDQAMMSYELPAVTTAFRGSSNDDSSQPSWAKFTQLLKSSAPKQQPSNQLQFSNNTPFWNASAAASVSEILQSGFYTAPPSSQFVGQAFEPKSPAVSRSNLSAKVNKEGVRDPCSSSSTKKSITGPAFKKPRVETPSPLPTFKVRKEKLGDRITALQQLVSPFGKTDTASVLHEAIDYIKFLHDQVSVLSTPYLKNGHPIQQQQSSDKPNDGDGTKKDLRSRGLCLVPIASTYPVASETAADFWHPTFGATFR